MYVNTAKLPWVSLREAGDDTPITAFTYSDWPAGAKTFNDIKNSGTMKDSNGVMISMFGSDAANEEVNYFLYGRVRMNGPIILLLAGVATLGTQIAVEHPIDGTTLANRKWVDTFTVTGGIFADLVDILDSATNRQAVLKFDIATINDLYMEIDLDGSSGAAAASMYAIITGY